MISGATQSSFKFLFEHFTQPENVAIDFNPHTLLQSNKEIKILWAHYNCDQQIYVNTDWEKITQIVCVSNWEKEQFIKYLKIPENKITVIRNGGADYFQPSEKKSKTLIYTSTPFRGLKYLPYIFAKVLQKHPDAKLKVFSGMNLYGQENDDYEPLYQELKLMPNVEYSKAIPHEELVHHYQDAAIFCYPNIWEETSCVSLIEAMRCGCYPIISNIGALPETSAGYGIIVEMLGENKSDGWRPTKDFCDNFASQIVKVLDTYKYNSDISEFACKHYDWKSIALEWREMIEKLNKKENIMSYEITKLSEKSSSEIVKDAEVLQRVYDEVFKWEEYDKEHAQGRSNFQIEKFIALDNFTVASSFNALLKNRRIMAEGLFTKIIEMKEKQREFDMKWKDTPKDKPIEFGVGDEKKYCWYDLDSLSLENFLRSSELEIRDRTQQIEFFDKLLNKLLEMNGGPVTREQFEQEDHIYWERRFANQAYDEMVSRQTGISIGNLHSMRRATAPTLVSHDVNRVKNGFPDLGKAIEGGQGQIEFILGLQEKVMDGIGEVTGQDIKALANENVAKRLDRLGNTSVPMKPLPINSQQQVSPKSLFNSEYLKK
jgi:glycosyltransferase involved in cell wall biosynthesis